MLVFSSMAFLVIPVAKVKAQTPINPSGEVTKYCFNTKTGNVETKTTTTAVSDICAIASGNEGDLKLIPDGTTGICVSKVGSPYTFVPVKNINGAPDPALIGKNGQCIDTKTTYVKLGASPVVPTKPDATTKPTTKPQTTTTSQAKGDCETGFHKAGPLCVPNSPFGANSIVNPSSIPELAGKIIRVLLYFAGIIAVIMIIVGGYLYMTAAGNESQATSGRKTLIDAIIGLVIVLLAYVIVQTLLNYLK